MFTTLSTVRRFHVVSFVLAAACFAMLSLCWQSSASGQDTGGDVNASVPTDVGENNSGGQEEGTAENPFEIQDSHIVNRILSSLWGFLCNMGYYLYANIAFFGLLFLAKLIQEILKRFRGFLSYFFCYRVGSLRFLANECLKLRNINNNVINNSSKKDDVLPLSLDAVNNVIKEDENQKMSAWSWIKGIFTSFFSSEKKSIYLPSDDLYLLIITSDEYKNDLERDTNNFDKHKKKVKTIYRNRVCSSVFFDFGGLIVICLICAAIETVSKSFG